MKNTHGNGSLRCFIAFCLMLAISLTSSIFAVVSAKDKSLAGEITVSGTSENGEKPFVLVNDDKAFTGRTLFSSSVIATPAMSSATLNLPKLGRIDVAPNSVLSLNFTDNSISGNLSAGEIKVFNHQGILITIQTPENVITNDTTQACSFTVDLRSGTTAAVAHSGMIFTNGARQNPEDDDDDNTRAMWIGIGTAAAIAGALVLYFALSDDDDVVSPVR